MTKKNIEKTEKLNDNKDDEKKDTKVKESKSIQINTPYVSVAITTESSKDTLNYVLVKVEHILDKYKCHHLIDKNGDVYSFGKFIGSKTDPPKKAEG